MRDRLIELLYEAEGQVNNDLPSVEQIADYLLEKEVIVPPCKIGDTAYIVGSITRQLVKDTVGSIVSFGDHVALNLKHGAVVMPEQIGVSVFFTEEEAFKAWKKGAIDERAD